MTKSKLSFFLFLFIGLTCFCLSAEASWANSIEPSYVGQNGAENRDLPTLTVPNASFYEAWSPAENTYWARYTLTNNSSDSSLLLEFDHWTNVEVFVQGKSIGATGKHLPFNERSFALANRNLVRLQIDPDQTLEVTARLRWEEPALNLPTDLKMHVYRVNDLVQKDSNQRKYVYFFIGLYSFIILFNAFLTYTLKSKTYMLYVTFVSINLFALLHNFGYTIEWLSELTFYPKLHGIIDVTFSTLFGLVILHFTSSFMHLSQYLPKARIPYRILQVLIILVSIPALFGFVNTTYELSSLVGLLTSVFVLIISIISAIRRVPFAKYYLAAVCFFLVGLFTFLMKEVGALPANDFTNYSLYIGSSFEALLFAIALGGRISALETDNKKQQAELIRQLKANEALHKKVHSELEEKVNERTAEIEKQKSQIEAKNQEVEESLVYAKNIQSAMIKNTEVISSFGLKNFVAQYSKQTVNGSFCWAHKVNAESLLIVTAESSQTGTPGAMLSMVSHVLLNKTVVEKGIAKPNLIIGELRKGLVNNFTLEDFMFDNTEKFYLSVCRFDLRTNKLTASCAGGNLLCGQQGELKVLIKNNEPLNFKQDSIQTFTEEEFDLNQGDVILTYPNGMLSEDKQPDFHNQLKAQIHNEMYVQEEFVTQHWKKTRPKEDQLLVGVQISQ